MILQQGHAFTLSVSSNQHNIMLNISGIKPNAEFCNAITVSTRQTTVAIEPAILFLFVFSEPGRCLFVVPLQF